MNVGLQPPAALRSAVARVRAGHGVGERRRFGYRRLHLLLARERHAMNQKKLRRLYTEEKLQVRRRSGRKRALDTRAPMTIPQQGPNQRWSLDFVADALSDGRRLRIPDRGGRRHPRMPGAGGRPLAQGICPTG